jgi:single-strand DNA-binding protein
MASFNRVTLMGNATRDPEVRETNSGKQVANITLAVNKKTGEQETVAFVDVVFWERTAEIVAQYVKKGTNLLVDGELVQDTWEQDGQKRSKLKVNAFKMVLVGRREDAPAPAPAPSVVSEETPF